MKNKLFFLALLITTQFISADNKETTATPMTELFSPDAEIIETSEDTQNSLDVNPINTIETTNNSSEQCCTLSSFITYWTTLVTNLPGLIKNTDSLIIQLIFVFLLGILMSLTPCIYPMIPITVGVLHARSRKSLGHNFLLSLSYTVGLATTFALFGLLAASSGQAFGYLMGNPIFVICIVAVLGYFAFSMFGFYNLSIPRFLQKKQSFSQQEGSSSYLPVFLFGMASGSVASPCLSPGLAFVLTIVATLASKFLGFLLLFAFGVGVSFPLLIIGTFSSSLNVLPRAGMWMLEIQKIFGFLLLGMCIYYLSNIIPLIATLSLITLLMLFMSIYYIYAAAKANSKTDQYIKSFLGIAATALFVFMVTQIVLEYLAPTHETSGWFSNYEEALVVAKQENKKVVMDFWAPYCSICKEITKTVLQNKEVAQALNNFVVLSINISDIDADLYTTLQQRYNIQGVPDIIIIDPTTGDVVKRWKSEIYEQDKSTIIQELNALTT